MNDMKTKNDNKEKAYWESKIFESSLNARLFINSDNKKDSDIAEMSFQIPDEIGNEISGMTNSNNLSLYVLMFTYIKVLLYKYTKNKSFFISSPVTNQNTENTDLLPILNNFENNKTFKELMINSREMIIESYNNQNNNEICEILKKNNINVNQLKHIICMMTNIHNFKDFSGCDLCFCFTQELEKIELKIVYDRKCFTNDFVIKIYDNFINLISKTINNFDIEMEEIYFLSEEEESELLYDLNDTKTDYLFNNSNIIELFEETVKRFPDKNALKFKDEVMTYHELNVKANQLAFMLIDQKLSAENSLIAVMVKRSFEMIVCILGILKSGAAYLPIDPKYPEDRISYMLNESKINTLITQDELLVKISFKGRIIDIKNLSEDDGHFENINNNRDLSDLAYVIFTSGTSGKPKGIKITCKNILAYVNAFIRKFSISDDDNILLQASYSFDHFVEELYPFILSGSEIVIVDEEEILNINKLKNIIKDNRLRILSLSPLMLNELNKIDDYEQYLSSVKLFLSGGDVLKREYISNLLQHARVFNTYGPTETTVCATYFNCNDLSIEYSNMPIGKPIANYRIYLMDENNNLVPMYGSGEICIAGDGVGIGYINCKEDNDKKFIENPYVKNEIIYKSGDQGVLTMDKNIMFSGRIDKQIKIRGYRIELEDIEKNLLKMTDIKETVVTVKEEKNDGKFICAYYVLNDNSSLDERSIKEILTVSLPHYMIPHYFIKLNKLPLTLNNFKIDMSKLPDPFELRDSQSDKKTEYKDDVHEQLSNIWKEIIDLPEDYNVSFDDSFFELGGHSISIIQLITSINEKYSIELPISILNDNITLRSIYDIVKGNEGI